MHGKAGEMARTVRAWVGCIMQAGALAPSTLEITWNAGNGQIMDRSGKHIRDAARRAPPVACVVSRKLRLGLDAVSLDNARPD